MSDMAKAYDCLKDEGYTHLTVNHSLNFVDLDTTNFIARRVQMTIYRRTVTFRRHLPPNQSLLSPVGQSDKDTLEHAW